MAHKDTLILFDVDGTLTVPRQRATDEMLNTLVELRKNYTKLLSQVCIQV